ncbi:hypothetical protein [Streptomyces hyaluromycini]|uniref:hypothetical protein n=1 Tax=Streptomyces hyaluromycini TaxID=1377993 RepID=UPI001237FCE9|nr:hypothetical protein [Streptomyces hyaluromycini]
MGDALLIHPKGRFDDRAAAFAGGIAEDPLHTLAVVDLPGSSLATEWQAVARLLSAARYGSPRLVFGRGTPDDIRTACRRIADRLEREVLAADGDLVPTVGGGLFVPGDDGAAWLRFRPGQDPEPVAQRFPKPHWEFSAPIRTTRPAGTRIVAQPLPAGVWLRDADPDPLAAHHRRAVEAVPTDPHRYLVVLGSPGTPPLSPDDVARFWDTVLPGARPAVRFVLYGTLDVPGDHASPGQALADALGHPAVLYDGLPCTDPGDRTVPAETTCLPTGFVPPAPAPAPDPGEAAVPPLPPLPLRPPLRTESGADASAVPPDASAPDAASPPWHEEADAADPSERSAGPGTEGATDLSEAPTVRNASSTDAGAEAEAGGEAGGDSGGGDPAEEPGSGSGPGHGSGAADLGEAPTVRSRSRAVRNGAPASTPEAGAEAEVEAESASARVPATVSAPASQAAPQPQPVPAAGPMPSADVAPPAEAAPAAPSPAPVQRPAPPASPRFRLESAAPEPEIDETDVIDVIDAVDAVDVMADVGVPAPTAGTAPDPGPGPAAGPAPGHAAGHSASAAAVPSASARAGAGAVRVQPVPRAAACALPPERGVAQERDWMRRTFSEQYNALAGSVSRVMSESPGLRGRSRTEAADALTDLVAVRLYLSGDPRQADAAVREAVPGPHVPLARCVTAGLRRLPSYRGPALLRTRLGDAERAWYREGGLATEWAFCHARTSLHPGPRGSGATDVLIWSMTARRTSSLDPAVPDRVVFLPGTVFRVLRAEGSAVLMRELSPSEAAEAAAAAANTRGGRGGGGDVAAKLDEIAVKGLEKILDALERTGTDAAAESADPPGLIVTPRAIRTEGAEQ